MEAQTQKNKDVNRKNFNPWILYAYDWISPTQQIIILYKKVMGLCFVSDFT